MDQAFTIWSFADKSRYKIALLLSVLHVRISLTKRLVELGCSSSPKSISNGGVLSKFYSIFTIKIVSISTQSCYIVSMAIFLFWVAIGFYTVPYRLA